MEKVVNLSSLWILHDTVITRQPDVAPLEFHWVLLFIHNLFNNHKRHHVLL
jgi:hypothetical protein